MKTRPKGDPKGRLNLLLNHNSSLNIQLIGRVVTLIPKTKQKSQEENKWFKF